MEIVDLSVLSLFKNGEIIPIALYTKESIYNIVEVINKICSEECYTFECIVIFKNTVTAIRIQYNTSNQKWYMP